MKKFLATLLILVFTLSLAAFAETPEYPMTADFVSTLDAKGIKYDFKGKDDNNYELVDVTYEFDNFGSLTFKCYFDTDSDGYPRMSIRTWYIIEFDPSNRAAVMEAVNQAVQDYKWACFFVDDSDNTVTYKYDMYLPDRGAGTVAYWTLTSATEIVNRCWEYFESVAK